MSKFDDFNARVERAKENADAKAAKNGSYRPQRDPGGSGLGGTFRSVLGDFLGELLAELLIRVWWVFLLAGAGVGVLAFGLGISFSAALTLALVVSVGFALVMAFLSEG